MIPKENLEHGAYYEGECRNARVARWNGEAKNPHFVHWRTKFGHRFIEKILCPEDDAVYDVFEAEKKIKEPTEEIPFEDPT